METFQEKVKKHLVAYAKNQSELKGRIGGVWRKREYDHILNNKEAYQYNLLPCFRIGLKKYICKNGIKLHADAHHLNSSQIMCLNFFYPLVCENKLSDILNIINPNEQWGAVKCAAFEKISDIDGKQRGATNFDFFIETTNGHKIYFEIKYTENDFGTAKTDKSHIEKWESMYKSLIINSPIIESKLINQEEFFKNYQIIRNIIHVQNPIKDYSIFVVPKDKSYTKLYDKANNVINDIVIKDSANHVQVRGWEEIIKAVENDPQLHEYYAEFKKKYLDFE